MLINIVIIHCVKVKNFKKLYQKEFFILLFYFLIILAFISLFYKFVRNTIFRHAIVRVKFATLARIMLKRWILG